MHLYGALALTTSCYSILKIICMLRDGIDVRVRRAWIGKTFGLVSYDTHQHHFEKRAVFVGCGVRAVGTKELPVGSGGGEE